MLIQDNDTVKRAARLGRTGRSRRIRGASALSRLPPGGESHAGRAGFASKARQGWPMAEPFETLITVADMRAHGADAVSASCWRCNRFWRSPIFALPPETTLAKVQALMKCHDCGNDRVHVTPVWPNGEPGLQ